MLGAEWSAASIRSEGHEVWPARPVPGIAWQVNVTADGRLIVAAFGDGTIRWFRVSDGEEVLALFIHPDGSAGSPGRRRATTMPRVGADDLIGWHINHGYDRRPISTPSRSSATALPARRDPARAADAEPRRRRSRAGSGPGGGPADGQGRSSQLAADACG